MKRRAAVAALFAMPGLAHAQALRCELPTEIVAPRPDMPTIEQPRRITATASYTLALIWNPQACRKQGTDRAGFDFQCQASNRFGFVLHGLWPNGASREWPQYCRSVALLSKQTVRANLCTTPSVQLLQHEWAKHGSCMAGTADDYFSRARLLYRSLRFPDMDALSRRQVLTAGSFAAAFAQSNRGMTADMVRVIEKQNNWLAEVWVCLDLRFRPAACPAHQYGLASSTQIKIWRGD
jgi:ribonuclease T2